jgi:hypothetical protein
LLAEVWGDTQFNAIGGFWLAHTEEWFDWKNFFIKKFYKAIIFLMAFLWN